MKIKIFILINTETATIIFHVIMWKVDYTLKYFLGTIISVQILRFIIRPWF